MNTFTVLSLYFDENTFILSLEEHFEYFYCNRVFLHSGTSTFTQVQDLSTSTFTQVQDLSTSTFTQVADLSTSTFTQVQELSISTFTEYKT